MSAPITVLLQQEFNNNDIREQTGMCTVNRLTNNKWLIDGN